LMDFVREVAPAFLVRGRSRGRFYRLELVQCDLWERASRSLSAGQRRRGWVVTCEVCWSRVDRGHTVFSKEAPDILSASLAT